MATSTQARVPVHLWIVGVLALLWNAFGCYDYLMTNMKNQAYMAQFTSDQLAYFDSLPSWLTGFWALGVWGGLAGAILLLVRSRYAVWAMALSCIGAIVGLGHQVTMVEMPASMTRGLMGLLPWVIILITIVLLWYSWSMGKKGVLR
jgi:hypothetical protein